MNNRSKNNKTKSFENVFITVGADKCYKESKIGEKKTIFTETFVNKSSGHYIMTASKINKI